MRCFCRAVSCFGYDQLRARKPLCGVAYLFWRSRELQSGQRLHVCPPWLVASSPQSRPFDGIEAAKNPASFGDLFAFWLSRKTDLEGPCPANGQHVFFREDEPGDPLPVGTQLAFLAHARHVIARIADGAQRRRRWSRGAGLAFWERYSGRNNMAAR
jgi:hypothetical protein